MDKVDSFREYIRNRIPEIKIPNGKKIGRYRLGKGMMANFRVGKDGVNVFFYSGDKQTSDSIFEKINQLGINGKKINDQYLLEPKSGIKNPNIVRIDIEIPFNGRDLNSDDLREEAYDVYSKLLEICKPIAKDDLEISNSLDNNEDIEIDDELVDLPKEWNILHGIVAVIYGAYNIKKDSLRFINNIIMPDFLNKLGAKWDLAKVWNEVSDELANEPFSYKFRLFSAIVYCSKALKTSDDIKDLIFSSVSDILESDFTLGTDEDEYLSVCMYYWYSDNLDDESKVDIKTILSNGIKPIVPDIRNLITLNPGTLDLNKWPALEKIVMEINKEYNDIFKGLSFDDYVKNISGNLEIKVEGRMHFYKFGAISDEIKNALESSISHTGHDNINDLIAEMWYGSPKNLLGPVPKEVLMEHPILDHLKTCSMGKLWQEFDLFYEVPVIDNDNTISFFKNQIAFFSAPVSTMKIANDSEKDEYDTEEDKNFLNCVNKLGYDFSGNLEWKKKYDIDGKKEDKVQFGEYLAQEGAKLSRFGWSGLEYLVRDNERRSNFGNINFENRFSVLEYGKFEIKSNTIISGSTNLSKLIWFKDKGINEFGPSKDNYRFSRVFYVDNPSGYYNEDDLINELDFIIENFKISDVTVFQNWPTDE